MTLEEYAVEKIKELENKKTELEVALKAKESEYKNANSIVKKLREENEQFRVILGEGITEKDYKDLVRGGSFRIYVSDSWKRNYDDLTEEEQETRKVFDFLCSVVKKYREEHPFPKKEESSEETESADEDESVK